MQVLCICDNWYMDIETGKTGKSFKIGKRYETVEPSEGIEKAGDIIVINEQGSRHIIKTDNGLTRFFDQYFQTL